MNRPEQNTKFIGDNDLRFPAVISALVDLERILYNSGKVRFFNLPIFKRFCPSLRDRVIVQVLQNKNESLARPKMSTL